MILLSSCFQDSFICDFQASALYCEQNLKAMFNEASISRLFRLIYLTNLSKRGRVLLERLSATEESLVRAWSQTM